MPGEYAASDSYPTDSGAARWDNDDRQESRQKVRRRRSKRNLAAVGQSIHDVVSGLFRSSTPQQPIGIPYENFTDAEGGQRIHNAIIFPQRLMSIGGGRKSAEHTSSFGRVIHRLSSRRVRSRATSNAQADGYASSSEEDVQQEQSLEEQSQPVLKERVFAPSGWHKLKRQISKGSVVKRKCSANDVGQHKDIEDLPANLKVKRVTLTYPPQFTASDYAQSLEDIGSTVGQRRYQLGEAGPSNTQNTKDAQMADDAEAFGSQPTLDKIYSLYNRAPSAERQDSYVLVTPRTMHSNKAALKSLEGNTPYEDGSGWQLNDRDKREIAQRLQLSNPRLDEKTPRAGLKVASIESAHEHELFSREQQRRISRYIEVAESPDGFDCEMEE